MLNVCVPQLPAFFKHNRASYKVMIIGKIVMTVQTVSRFCIQQGAEVFPYYGIPAVEEVALFEPDIFILCLPAPENLFLQIDRPFILWSEQFTDIKLPVASNRTELVNLLQQTLFTRGIEV